MPGQIRLARSGDMADLCFNDNAYSRDIPINL